MAPASKTQTTSTLVCILLLCLLAGLLFEYTSRIREPWFGELSPDGHNWLTAQTVHFTRNWFHEGILESRFGMLQNPPSVEFPTLESRMVYVSYPPGSLLPVYAFSRLTGREPSPALVMRYNLINHLLIALSLSLTVFLLLVRSRHSHGSALVLAVIPMAVELLMPSPLYYHQNVFFTDQAILLPFALFVLLEVARGSTAPGRAQRCVAWLQAGLLFYGMLTEWLFCFVALTVYLKRALNGELGRQWRPFLAGSSLYWLPAAGAMGLFALQVSLLDGWGIAVERFTFRTAASPDGREYVKNFFDQFWRDHVGNAFGEPALPLLWGSLAVLLVVSALTVIRLRKRGQVADEDCQLLSAVALLLLPCFAQVYFFRNHSVIHDFAALKFSLPLATVPFVLAPLLVLRQFGQRLTDLYVEMPGIFRRAAPGTTKFPVLVVLILFLAGYYVGTQHGRFASFFPERGDYGAENFLARHTSFEDIVFSPHYSIPPVPPQQVSYSMKRVYALTSLDEIREKLGPIEADYSVNLLLFKSREVGVPGLEILLSGADRVVEDDRHLLYQIPRDRVLLLLRDS